MNLHLDREALIICPSAKQGIHINVLLTEIIEKDVFRNDYEVITENLLFTYIPYETAIGGIKKVIDSGYFC